MNLKLHIATICLTLQSCSAVANEQAVSEYEALGSLLLGKTRSEVRQILEDKKLRYHFNSTYTTRDSTDLSRHQLDRDTYLHLGYARVGGISIEDDQTVSKSRVLSLGDLKKKVPEGTFESIRFIHHCPAHSGQSFEPLALIQAVNHFHDLGADESLRRLRIYNDLAVRREFKLNWGYDLDEQRIFFILRLLFVRKDGDPRMPKIALGARIPNVNVDDQDWPLFPLVEHGNIPFVLTFGYVLAGTPTPPLSHIEYCEKHCQLREAPLAPSMSPIEAVEDIYSSQEWQKLFADVEPSYLGGRGSTWQRYSIRCQALRCYPPELGLPFELPRQNDFRRSGDGKARQAWNEYLKELRNVKVKWDEETQEFICEQAVGE